LTPEPVFGTIGRMDTALVKMVAEDRANAQKLIRGIEVAIQRSYDSDLIRDGAGKAITSADEIKRRANLCIDMAKQLRNDAGWSVFRIIDAMPLLLRRRLDGLDYDPTSLAARASWFPAHLSRRAL
jgi:hypothetical protein